MRNRKIGVSRTRYDLGNCGIRLRMRVVLPLPRNPVMIVTGVGAMVAKEFGRTNN